MHAYQQKQNELSRFLQILSRKKWLILCCIVGALTPIIYFNKVSLPVYEASIMVVCEEVRGTIPSFDVAQPRLRNTFILNQIQEIKSWSLANEVVKVIPDKVRKSFSASEQLAANVDEEDFYTSIIQKNISAETVTNSDVVKIKAQAHDPKAASIIANTVAEILHQRNLDARLGEIHSVRKTIEDQLNKFKQKVRATEQALRDYKERNKITFLDQESQEVFRRITEAEVEYNRVKTELDAAKRRLAFVKDKLSQQRKELIPSITTTTSPWAQRLKENLIELEVQYTNLKVHNYDENHPQMKKIKSQIEETKKNLMQETLKIAKGENTLDPLSQIQRDLEEIASLEVEIHTYQAQENALKEVLDGYNNSLKTVPEKELELGRLIRDKAVADNIYTMLLQKREEAKITEAEKIGNIRVIDPARVPKQPIKPRKMLNFILGFIVGCSLGIGLALFLDVVDTTIKTAEEVEQYTGLPVLASIPRIRNSKNFSKYKGLRDSENGKLTAITPKLIAKLEPTSPATEAFRILRTNIQFTGLDSSVKTILFTSTSPEEGKSLITANLAIALAQMGLKTLLIDADLRRPVLHALFKKAMRPGLMDILLSTNNSTAKKNQRLVPGSVLSDYSNAKVMRPPGHGTINSVTIENFETLIKKTIHSTDISNLYLITCGTIPSNPVEILASKNMKTIVSTVRNNYELVLFDLPPVIAVTDAVVLSSVVDAIIFVIKAGKSTQPEILKARSMLEKVNGNIIGAVLNHVSDREGYSYYYYYSKNNRSYKSI